MGELINNAKRFGGVLTINWHDRSSAPERLRGEVYMELLDELKKMGAWFPTTDQAVSWFRKRLSARIESVANDADTVRVKVSLDDKPNNLPGLRLRVHRPVMPGQVQPQDQFAEATVNQSGDVEVAV